LPLPERRALMWSNSVISSIAAPADHDAAWLQKGVPGTSIEPASTVGPTGLVSEARIGRPMPSPHAIVVRAYATNRYRVEREDFIAALSCWRKPAARPTFRSAHSRRLGSTRSGAAGPLAR